MAKRKIIILEEMPNYISYVGHIVDKDGNEIYFYRHFDWDEPYCNNVRKGDEFFLINRQDIDVPGIVMHGFFDSDEELTPVYWSERGVSRVYLRDVQIVDPKKYRPLSISALQTAMPEINWGPGPSGWKVTGPYIKKLRTMWKEYLEMNDSFAEEK